MEAWLPLFDIFLNSPSPEGEAALWLQQSFNTSTTTTTTTPTSFLSLLSKPVDVILANSSTTSSPTHSKRVMWIQTLPDAIQSRILSFLRVEKRRFCARDLSLLAKNMLKEGKDVDFWVKKSAHHLLDEMPEPDFSWVSSMSLDSADDDVDEEFETLPSWLQSSTDASKSLFPCPSLSNDQLGDRFYDEKKDESLAIEDEDEYIEDSILNQVLDEMETVEMDNNPIDPEICRKAETLRAQMSTFESTSKTQGLASEIRELCVGEGRRRDACRILTLIEPWEADDETASVLISNLWSGGQENNEWPSHVLCSVVLPKLLDLREPASRVLIMAMIEFCKQHQKAAADALLFPLLLRKEGINTFMCDVITRVIRECLHPAHVSSICQKLLSGEPELMRFVCLPCHQILISHELVWTEPLFALFQNILNHNVYLTQDSIDRLVSTVQELADRYAKSLKFGNFLLSLVTKCDALLKSHKLLLTEAVARTNTFMTKSILSKLDCL